MSSYDRFWPGSGKLKNGFDQILTSWFLDPPARNMLSAQFQFSTTWAIAQAKMSAGIWEQECDLFIPIFYQGKVPHPTCKRVFLSFRKMSNANLKYGYVLIKTGDEREIPNA